MKPLRQMADRWVPKPPGTVQKLSLYYGPFTVPPGQDFNRVTLDLPMYDGWLEYVAPYMRRVTDLSEPNHQQAHIQCGALQHLGEAAVAALVEAPRTVVTVLLPDHVVEQDQPGAL